jgi:hypothetical protein
MPTGQETVKSDESFTGTEVLAQESPLRRQAPEQPPSDKGGYSREVQVR